MSCQMVGSHEPRIGGWGRDLSFVDLMVQGVHWTTKVGGCSAGTSLKSGLSLKIEEPQMKGSVGFERKW